MKKRLWILSVLAMLLAVLLVPGFATGETVTVSSVTAQPGQVVELTVSLAGFPEANTLALQFEPETGLEFVKEQSDWTIAGDLLKDIDSANHTGVWTTSAAQVDVNTQILKLAFRVPETLANPADPVYTVRCTIVVQKDAQELGTVEAIGQITVSVPATDLSLDQETVNLDLQSNKTATLNATVTPSNTTDTLVWTSSDSSIVSIEGGKLTALKEGTVTVTVQAGSISRSCTVTVVCAHDLVQTPAKDADCQGPGNLEYYTCSTCGKVFTADKTTETTVEEQSIPQTDHAGGSATCSTQALCQWCGTPYGNKLPHEYDTAWLSDDNEHWHNCKNCGEAGENAPHSYQWVVDKPATAEETGLKHEECVCGLKRSENTEIPVVDHVHSGITHHDGKRPNCHETGTLEYWTCGSDECAGKLYGDAACQLEITDLELPVDPNYHTGGTTVKNVVQGNCGKAGYTGDTYCNSCGVPVAEGETIPATGDHIPKASYDTNSTYHWKECVMCNHTLSARQEHTYEWVVDKAPTEEAEGLQHQQCTACHHITSKDTPIEKAEHNPLPVAGKDPTCTEAGSLEHYYCAGCDRYYANENGSIGQQITADAVTVPALGHSYGTSWYSNAQGHWHSCSCGENSQTEAHDPKLVGAVDATYEGYGYSGDTVCSVCGYEIAQGYELPILQQPKETDYSWILWASLALLSIAGLAVVSILMNKNKNEE